ncbi:MAG: copper amine oxidase N-terminal domain-containing protein [Clostridiales bacterium]|nr:copper amine oxidase N-terminal domain-containing protein [Clostridiales bacterium]
MKRKRTTFVCLVVFCFVLVQPIFADDSIVVTLDNRTMSFDQAPFIENSRLLVPIRAIAEAAYMEVRYDGAAGAVTLLKTERLLKLPLNNDDPYIDGKNHTVTMSIGSSYAIVDGKEKALDVPAKIVGSRTFVPLRFISESLDMDVFWDSKTRQVIINTRLRGNKPLSGESFFPTISKKTTSISKGDSTISLGMDVTDMWKQFGSPAFAYGHGYPAPQVYYIYDDVWFTCLLGKVITIDLSTAGALKTGAGISLSDSAPDIMSAYGVSSEYIDAHTDYNDKETKIALLYKGDSLVDSQADATHEIDFFVSGGKIDGITIQDLVTIHELAPNGM